MSSNFLSKKFFLKVYTRWNMTVDTIHQKRFKAHQGQMIKWIFKLFIDYSLINLVLKIWRPQHKINDFLYALNIHYTHIFLNFFLHIFISVCCVFISIYTFVCVFVECLFLQFSHLNDVCCMFVSIYTCV